MDCLCCLIYLWVKLAAVVFFDVGPSFHHHHQPPKTNTTTLRPTDDPGKPFALPATLRHMLELLVLASPMALAMAAPLPYLTTLAASVARGGVVVKTPLALERLGRVQVCVGGLRREKKLWFVYRIFDPHLKPYFF